MFPLFCHSHLYQGSATHSLSLQPAEIVANLWVFKAFEASGASKEQEIWNYRITYSGRIFCCDVHCLITFIDSSLVAGGLQEHHLSSFFRLLLEFCLVGDFKREQTCSFQLV